MYTDACLLTAQLREAHASAWQKISEPGDFFTGAQRTDIVRAARAALECPLCAERKAALSPNTPTGSHTDHTALPPILVDAVHRIRSDPGRLTRRWFEAVVEEVSVQAYVEMVAVLNATVIIDTLHMSLGLPLPPVPEAQPGQPTGNFNAAAVDGGAWVPLLDGADALADHGLPEVPNIARSLGLVPSALQLFFGTFRPHYALKDIPLSISQAQAEFVAARVSALNECFY